MQAFEHDNANRPQTQKFASDGRSRSNLILGTDVEAIALGRARRTRLKTRLHRRRVLERSQARATQGSSRLRGERDDKHGIFRPKSVCRLLISAQLTRFSGASTDLRWI